MVSATVAFSAVVTSDYWTTPRLWPAGCRPVIFSFELVTRNAGTLLVPAAHAEAVELVLRAHPEVLAIGRMQEPLAPQEVSELRRAA